ncbi:MAG: TonB-dependent receptor [Sphingobium sp.]
MKTMMLGGAALAVLFTTPAFAQQQAATPEAADRAAAEETGLPDIVVTAQRRTEKLQDVAVSATAFDSAALAAKSIVSIADLQAASPALSVTDGGIIQAVNIRGIGLASNSPNVTAGVANYVDGIFQPPIVQANSFYDLASIEVLRGPQGTLVGSNSTGGAIFINSANPNLNSGLGGYFEVTAGNYDYVGSEAAVNIPISSDFGMRVAGFYRHRDSYFHDVGPVRNDAGRLREGGGRVSLLWRPGSFQALAKFSLNDRDGGGYPYRPILGTAYANYRVGDIRTLSFDTKVANRDLAFQASLELRQELANGITLRSLTGYQSKRIKNLNDLDASQAPGGVSEDYFAGEKVYTEEINIISPTDGPFDWILGGYFQRNDITVRILQDQGGFPTDILPINQRTTTGFFAQGNYELTQGLELQTGARYSTYKATGTGAVLIGRGIPGFPTDGLVVADLTGSHKDSLVTGKVALNWKVDSVNLLYALAARGYKPGGFNSVVSEFDKEKVMSYEAGWKSTLLGGKIRTQINAFYNQYANFQFNVIEPSTGFAGVQNLSSVKIKGAEAQVQGRFGGFGFDGNVAYVHSKLASVIFVDDRLLGAGSLGPQCAPSVPSNPPVCFNYTSKPGGGGPNLYAPKWTWSLGADYRFELGGGTTLTPRLNWSYLGSQFTSLAYSPATDLLRSRRLLSGMVTLRTQSGLKLEAFGTNLTNRKYISGQFGINEFYGAPREYGLRFGMDF